MYNKYLNIYLELIKQSAISGLTPAPLIQKIFSDIKKQNFNKSFILIYNDKDVYNFLPSNYKKYFKNEILSLGKNINYLIILNIKIFNNIAKLQEYSNNLTLLIQKINTDKNFKLNKQELLQNYLKFIENLLDQQQIIQIQQLPKNISFYILNKFIKKFIPKYEIDKRWSALRILNFIQSDIKRIINLVNSTSGLSVNELCQTCGLIFINNKLFSNKNNLEQIYSILNHELDHHFYFRFNDTMKFNNHLNMNQNNDADKIKYLFDNTEINSRITDLCNIFNNIVLPVQKQNALKSIINLLTNTTIKNQNQMKTYIHSNIQNIKWVSHITEQHIQTLYINLLYFTQNKIKELILKRLQKQYDYFMKKYNTAKKQFKYNNSLKRKFNI